MVEFILIQTLIYFSCGLLLWLILRLVAPSGTALPLSRLVVSVIVLAVLLNLSRRFLLPLIGAWFFVADLLATMLAIKLFFRISSLRSVVVALIFWVIVSAVSLFFAVRSSEKDGSPNKARAANPAVGVRVQVRCDWPIAI